jgi:hypothetical protein
LSDALFTLVRALLARAGPSMTSYTLWVLSEPLGSDVVLIAEAPEGTLLEPFFAGDERGIHEFLATHGMPSQITANVSTAVRVVREADPRLFRVAATLLKPKELMGPLVKLVLRAYRTQRP